MIINVNCYHMCVDYVCKMDLSVAHSRHFVEDISGISCVFQEVNNLFHGSLFNVTDNLELQSIRVEVDKMACLSQ